MGEIGASNLALQKEISEALASKALMQEEIANLELELAEVTAAKSDIQEKFSQLVEESARACPLVDQTTQYCAPEAFNLIGEYIELSDQGKCATRTGGVTGGICVGAFPLRRNPEGRYFEVRVDSWLKGGARALAVGVACGLEQVDLVQGHIRASEARELGRVWLAGYDKGGALFFADGKETKIPSSAWRPVTHVQMNTRIGVLLAEPERPDSETTLVIFQDDEERLRLPLSGRQLARNEELFAVVDLQGAAKTVSFVEGAQPPSRADNGGVVGLEDKPQSDRIVQATGFEGGA